MLAPRKASTEMPLTSLIFLTFGKDRVRTFLGWSPGLRSLIASAQMPCGCLIGSYETWRGDVIDVIDSTGHNCGAADHRKNTLIRHAAYSAVAPSPSDDFEPAAKVPPAG